jgi:hypothetical protein
MLVALAEVLSLEDLRDGGGRRQREQLSHVHLRGPLRVPVDLGRLDVDHLPGLSEVRSGVRADVLVREHGAGLRLSRRIPDPRGEVSDDQDGDVTGVLELPQLPQDDGVSQGEVRATRIDAQLDAEGTTVSEPLLQPTRGNEVDAAARERRQSVGGHRAAMLSHLPDPAGEQGYTRPR